MPARSRNVDAFFDSFPVFDKSNAVAVTRGKYFIKKTVRAAV